MKLVLARPYLQIQKSSFVDGYGVFATKNFEIGELIEECYSLFISTSNKEFLANYCFAWPTDPQNGHIIPLGYGCIYNHSQNPNAEYELDVCNQLVKFYAIRAINENEEIFIHYGKFWFKTRGIKPIEIPEDAAYSEYYMTMMGLESGKLGE